ncbi:N-acetylglucosamine-1-phosphate transferase [Naegleria gruberi]|uniref:N-acetylglucosamine-1-phosphate transferase n=1 Tax=Naegleria gruberi TaxID=5762 RepID=D2UYF8_NAEGR|nr:N-acetylglucosamine-1-phosphate transferase [Naegleria gruberi]EFC50785.1 N-acetylglucosamine-1-phosphate transferase [Naegleria gruberi]|eukprot:XP_002683529.1 N-acetylglucosamine-1-phosphate transferase [Naegleria gruberi strain NEG-M]
MYRDNIMKINSVSKLCYEPMDIVYTWVNGSDPIHKNLVKRFNALEKEKEEKSNVDNTKTIESAATKTSSNTTTTSTTDSSKSNQKTTNNYHLKGVGNAHVKTQENKTKKRRRLLSVKSTSKKKQETNKKSIPQTNKNAKVTKKTKAPVTKKTNSSKKTTKPPVTKQQHTKVEKKGATGKKAKTNKALTKKTTKKSKKENTPKVKNDSEIINNGTTTKNATKTDDTNSSNRFRDNDELRYSLRSLERFAPWVRNVYIVTSGQVPSWLNVKNPKVKIVKHADVYRNPIHLPVFSSPSIESQIHRIPGLSKKFIYLNDDVMFGNDVYPEDFYSHSTGQKVFLSWEVPPCHEGCQESWLGDGYCDVSCNVTQCDFDGGDCVGPNVRFSYGSSSSSSSYGNYGGNYNYGSNSNSFWSSTNTKNYCSASCSDSWIGDRFCDRPCNVKECGYDAGDCEFKELKTELEHVQLENSISVIYVRNIEPSIYLDLSKIFKDAQITNGNHENEKLVRSSTISQKEKLLIFTFNYQSLKSNVTKYSNNTNFYEEHVPVSLEAERVLNDTSKTDTFQNTHSTTFEQLGTKLTITKSFIVKVVSNHTFNYIAKKFNLSNETSIFGIHESQESELAADKNYNKALVVSTYFSKTQLNAIVGKNNSTKPAEKATKTTPETDWFNSWNNINSDTQENDKSVTNTKKQSGSKLETKATEIDDISENVIKTNPVITENQAVRPASIDTKKAQVKLEEKKTEPMKNTLETVTKETPTSTLDTIQAKKDTEIKPVTKKIEDDLTKKVVDIKTETKQKEKATEIDDISENVIKTNPVIATEKQQVPKTPEKSPTQEADNYNIDNLNSDELRYLKKLLKKKNRKLLGISSPSNIRPSYSNRIPIVQSHPEEIVNSLRFNLAEKEKNQEKYENIKKRIEREIKSENYDDSSNSVTTESSTPVRIGRKLLDKFGDSLIHVNKLLNREYGRASRKVPAHMPHMIDRDIMFELQKKWEYEFNVTSSNRFRSSSDMQYTFTYFYYLMHEGIHYNVSRFLREHVDTNNDNVLDNYEIRNLANLMYHKYKIPLSKLTDLHTNITSSINTINDEMKKERGGLEKPKKKTKKGKKKTPTPEISTSPINTTATTNSTKNSEDDEFGSYFWASTKSNKKWKSWSYFEDFSEFKEYHQTVRNILYGHLNYTRLVLSRYQAMDDSAFRTKPILEDFVNSGLSDIVKTKAHKSEQRFPFTLEDLSQVGFHMIRDDEDKVGDQLDELRRNRPKFICLNDDMNQTKPNEQVVEMLHNFYNWYFPNRSQFELQDSEENPFLYIDELMEHYNNVRYNRYVYDAIIVGVICFICCCCLIVRKLFKSKGGNKSGRNFKNQTNMGTSFTDEKDQTSIGQPITAGTSSSVGIGQTLTHHRTVNDKPEIV